jgi:hypothetical protein
MHRATSRVLLGCAVGALREALSCALHLSLFAPAARIPFMATVWRVVQQPQGAVLPAVLGAGSDFQRHSNTARPNPSFEPTRYGRQRKPGLRYSVHCLSPGLRRLPPRAAQLER